jgi:cytochrome c biogenesis protein CcmG/thiol:disulfide interchange protein DsbE
MRPFNRRIAFYTLILLTSALWIWISRTPIGSTTYGAIPAPQKGFLAPDFSLQTSDGKIIRLSEFRGRPVLLNIWASWCSPCKAEMPALQSVYQAYVSQGFVILGVNAANQDDASQAISFVEAQGLKFPILFDENGEISRKYQIRALPSTFFIDSQGIIQDIVVGGPMSEALIQIRVQQLINLDQKGTP